MAKKNIKKTNNMKTNQTTNEAAQLAGMCIFTIVLIAMVCINLLKSN
jgi:hypothetical protein